MFEVQVCGKFAEMARKHQACKESQGLSRRFMLVFMRVQTCSILKTLPVPLMVGIPSRL